MGELQESRLESLPAVRSVVSSAPLRWVRSGWYDMLRAPAASLFCGVVLALMGLRPTTHEPRITDLRQEPQP
jgi:hypothetical protein